MSGPRGLSRPTQGVPDAQAMVGLDSGGGIRTRDLRVMSPTSYQTAPPRGGPSMLATVRGQARGSGGVGRGVVVPAFFGGLWVVALVVDVGVDVPGVVVEHLGVVGRVGGLGVSEGGFAVADAVGAFVTHHARDPTRGPRPHHTSSSLSCARAAAGRWARARGLAGRAAAAAR